MNTDVLNGIDLSGGGVFVIMVGPPGSGKTSFAEVLVDEYSFIRVCPDDIRKEIIGDSSNQNHNEEVFAKVYSLLDSYLKQGFNVVYDATNCRSTYRLKVLNTIKHLANKIVCFCATASIGECLDRNKNRYDRLVPENVIERMYFTLKKHPPTIFEGYDLIVSF